VAFSALAFVWGQEGACSANAEKVLPEYDVKAAFLFNVAKYVKWPPQAFPDGSAPLVIGVLGKDPFGPVLDRVVQNRQIERRTVILRRGTSPGDFRGAHLVFIAESERDRAAAVCAALEQMNILTVADSPAIQRWAAVTFRLEAGRLAFVVNLPAADRASVKISSKLLHLASDVTPGIFSPQP
jgi:hypothetical protein